MQGGMPPEIDPQTGQPMQGPPSGEIEQVIYDLSGGLEQLAQAFEQMQQQHQQVAQQVAEMQQVMTQMAEGLQVVKQNLLED